MLLKAPMHITLSEPGVLNARDLVSFDPCSEGLRRFKAAEARMGRRGQGIPLTAEGAEVLANWCERSDISWLIDRAIHGYNNFGNTTTPIGNLIDKKLGHDSGGFRILGVRAPLSVEECPHNRVGYSKRWMRCYVAAAFAAIKEMQKP